MHPGSGTVGGCRMWPLTVPHGGPSELYKCDYAVNVPFLREILFQIYFISIIALH